MNALELWIAATVVVALVFIGVGVATMDDPETADPDINPEDYVTCRVVFSIIPAVAVVFVFAMIVNFPTRTLTIAGIVCGVTVLTCFYWWLGKRRVRRIRRKPRENHKSPAEPSHEQP